MPAKQLELQPIQLNLLKFDPNNPRIPSSVNVGDEQAIIKWMLKDATIVELMGSIGEHGYFAGEPLLVVKEGDFFLVIEGNRRLAALKLLSNPSLATTRKKAVAEAVKIANHHPVQIPCVVYDTRKEILNYLGYRHVTGIKPWDPLAKARYLEQLFPQTSARRFEEKFKELARSIGSRADYVGRLLTGLSIFKQIKKANFYDIKDLNEEVINFSVLTTALNYKNIAKFLGLGDAKDPKVKGLKAARLKELIKWMFEENSEGEKRIGESRDLSDLDEVVANKEALAQFRAGLNLQDAAKVAQAAKDDPSQVLTVMLLELSSLLSRIQLQISKQRKPNAEQLALLKEIKLSYQEILKFFS